MEEFVRSAATVNWWLSVVVVGLLLNLISSYLKPALDRAWSRVSDSARAASEANQKRRADWVEYLRSHEHAQIILHAREARQRARSIQSMLLAMSLFALGGVFAAFPEMIAGSGRGVAIGPFLIGAVSFMMSYSASVDASKCASLLKEALKDLPLPYNL